MLTPERCAAIPTRRGNRVVFTLTEYNQDPERDGAMVRALEQAYDELWFWPQQFGDLAHMEAVASRPVNVLEPSLAALDEFLSGDPVDYVGTRLHAGIRALQHGRRAIIVGVDNRALEMGADTGLPVIHQDAIETLGERIAAEWPTEIGLPVEAIERWKAQFAASRSYQAT
jgi:polysaccharide pyruvyl transferase WcaK-like protein